MWYPPKVTQAPTTEALTLDETKRRLRVDFPDDDEDIGAMIEAALDHVERYCGTVITPRTIEVKCDGWSDLSRLPVAPVQSVSSISYVASDGSVATLADTEYELRNDDLEVSIVPRTGKVWPARQSGSRITLTVVAGYATAPAAVKQAMLLHIADSYEIRENKSAGDYTAFDALLANYRRG